MIKDKLLVENDLRLLKTSLKECIGIVEELEKRIKDMEYNDM